MPNRPPVADAGFDQDTAIGKLVTLDGNKSKDPDADAFDYQWNLPYTTHRQ